MRALIVAPSLANPAYIKDIPEPRQCAGALEVRRLVLGVCATGREMPSGVRGPAPGGAKQRTIGPLGRVRKFGGVGASGCAFSIDLGKHCAVAALQQASKGWRGRLIMGRVPAERWTKGTGAAAARR